MESKKRECSLSIALYFWFEKQPPWQLVTPARFYIAEASRFFLGRPDSTSQVPTYVIGLLPKTDVPTYLYNINASRIRTG